MSAYLWYTYHNEFIICFQDNKIQFDKKVPDNQEDKEHCPVMEQKEYAEGKQDEACGKDIEEGHAGLCL